MDERYISRDGRNFMKCKNELDDPSLPHQLDKQLRSYYSEKNFSKQTNEYSILDNMYFYR